MAADRETLPDRSASPGPWMRVVTERSFSSLHKSWAAIDRTEYLDMDAAVKRLHEAMMERPDAALRDWLDCALNGWGDESPLPADEGEASRG